MIVRPTVMKLKAQGMNKDGSYSSGVTSPTKLTGWLPRVDSVVFNDGLKVKGGGLANILASISYTAIADHNVRIYLNGSQIAIGPTVDRGTLTASANNVLLKNDDILEVYAYSDSSSRTGVSATNTFLTVSPVS